MLILRMGFGVIQCIGKLLAVRQLGEMAKRQKLEHMWEDKLAINFNVVMGRVVCDYEEGK